MAHPCNVALPCRRRHLGDLGHVSLQTGIHDATANIGGEDVGTAALAQMVFDPKTHDRKLDGGLLKAAATTTTQPNDTGLGNGGGSLIASALSEGSKFIAKGFVHASRDGGLFAHVDFVLHEVEEVLAREMLQIGVAKAESGAQAWTMAMTADFWHCQTVLLMKRKRQKGKVDNNLQNEAKSRQEVSL